jgi:methionyl-tRNA synthetase
MASYRRILVTAALPYANGPVHVGHLAGAYLPADVFCRYHRMRGSELVFICGSDEHGVAIIARARKDGVPPREIVDRYHAMMKDAFVRFGMSFDYYGRTTSETHRETSQEFFRKLAHDGLLRLETKEQLYDPEAELFLADRFVVGTCPKCGYARAYGDQCESCGSSLSVSDLIDPKSALTDATPVSRETTHWVLPLDHVQPRLEAWLAEKTHWKTNVLGQVRSWLTAGLEGREVTRDLPWGVPVPADVAKEAGVDATGKVLYVWLDAPIGYISATREWAALHPGESFERWWKSEDTRLLHFIGKDNIVFHTLMFPAMLMAYGGYVLPENVPANEFLNLEGRKISTSQGWAVWAHEALDAFPADYLRYALLRMLPETRDADFTWSEFRASVNNELADNLGNFMNRTLQFCTKYLGGTVPELVDPSDADREVLDRMASAPDTLGDLVDTHRLRDAILELMALSRLGNKYFNDETPWATREADPRRCRNTIHVSLQLCASLSILAEPFLPFTAKAARSMLALEGVRSSEPGASGALGWEAAARSLLVAGHALGTPEILIRKIEDEAIENQRKKLESGARAPEGPPYAPSKPAIAFDDFAKIDLRVGVVKKCERVPKSQKLLRCEVDLGFEVRQILAGVGEKLTPESLLGARVVVVANLAPRKMLGLESAGMLLMATDRGGELVPVTADREAGSTVT